MDSEMKCGKCGRPAPGTPEAMEPVWEIVRVVERICGNEEGRIHSSVTGIVEATIKARLAKEGEALNRLGEELWNATDARDKAEARIAKLELVIEYARAWAAHRKEHGSTQSSMTGFERTVRYSYEDDLAEAVKQLDEAKSME